MQKTLCALGIALTWPLLAQSPQDTTLISDGGGGSTPGTVGITLQCSILGASATPSAVTGAMRHLGGDATFNVPWNGRTSAPARGRTLLQFDSPSIGGVVYTALPSSRVLHYGKQSDCAVTYVPSSTVAGFIAGLELTQGTQTAANSVPLIAYRDGVLKILGCGLNFTTASYQVTFTANGVTTDYFVNGNLSPSVNDGAWDGDGRRCTFLPIPGDLLVPGVQISVTLINAPEAPFGRSDLFPAARTLTPGFVQLANPVPTIRIVPITYGGKIPPMMMNGAKWFAMVEKLKRFLPFRDLSFQYYDPLAYESLTALIAPWNRTAQNCWVTLTQGMYYAVGAGDPVVGIIDGLSPAGLELGSFAGGITLTNGSSILPASTILTWENLSTESAQVFAHEFGHQSQRRHAPSKTPAPGSQAASDPDNTYPYQKGNSSTGAMFTHQDSTGIRDLAPSRGAYESATEKPYSHELMGYGGFPANAGTSDYTYLAIQKYWGSTILSTTASTLAPEVPQHALPRQVVELLGSPDAKTFHDKAKGLIQGIP